MYIHGNRCWLSALVGLLALSSCKSSPQSLVTIDVKSNQAFTGVTLTLLANDTIAKSFAGVNLDPTTALRVGVYLPSAVTGDVPIAAAVEQGGCVVAQGTATALVTSGQVSAPVALTVIAIATCVPIPDAGSGMGGDNRGIGGAGGGHVVGFGGGPGAGGSTAGVGGSTSATGTGGGPGQGGSPGIGGATGVGTGGALSGSGGAGTGTGGMNQGVGGSGACGNLIDDMEDHTGFICQGSGRVGSWYSYIDTTSTSTISPPVDERPALPEKLNAARGASQYAMHEHGTDTSYAGLGCWLNNAAVTTIPSTFNATGLLGVSFYAIGTGGVKVIVQTRATISTVYGGACMATATVSCYGASSASMTTSTESWNFYTVPFSQLTPGVAAFDPSTLWSVEFQPGRSGAFDFWIDDVSFY